MVVASLPGAPGAWGGSADVAATPTGSSDRPAGARKPGGRATVAVSFRSPAPGMGSVRLVGPQKVIVVQPIAQHHATAKLHLRPGRYRVQSQPSVAGGQTFLSKSAVRTLVVRAGGVTRLRVRLVPTRSSGDLSAAGVTSSSVSLAWSAAQRGEVRLRRAVGTVAPRLPRAGVAVKTGKGTTTVDAGLAAGTTYSYSLFTRSARGRWSGPVRLTVGTASGAGVAFVRKPTAVVLPSGAGDQVAFVVGGGVSVRLPAGVGTPIAGGAVVLPVSAALPGGYVGVVDGISNDGRTVTLTQGALTDVFDFLDLNLSLDGGEQVGTARVVARGSGDAGRAAAATKRGCRDVSLGVDMSNPRVSMKPGGHLNVSIQSTWHVPTNVTVDAELSPTFTFSADIDASISGKCVVKLPKLTANWAPGGVPLALVVDPEISASGTLSAHLPDSRFSLTLGAWDKAHFGTGGVGNDGGLIFRPSNPSLGDGATLAAKFGIEAGVDVTFGLGAAKQEVGAVAGISGYFHAVDASVESTIAKRPCITVDAQSDIGLQLEAKAWAGPLSGSVTYKIPHLDGVLHWPGQPADYPRGCSEDVTITTTSLPDAVLGAQYAEQLAASGGHGPYTWELTGGELPDGLGLSSSGRISGTPLAAGSATLTAKATSARGGTAAGTLTLKVVDDGGLDTPGATVDLDELRSGTVTVPLIAPLPTYGYGSMGTITTWHLVNGPLPAGLRLGSATSCGCKAIVGTPTQPGVWPLTLRAVDADGHRVTVSVPLTISALPTIAHVNQTPTRTLARFLFTTSSDGGVRHLTRTDRETGATLDVFAATHPPAECLNSQRGYSFQSSTDSGRFAVVSCTWSEVHEPFRTHLYLLDAEAGTTQLVDVPNGAAQPISQSNIVTPRHGVSEDGTKVLFITDEEYTDAASAEQATEDHLYLRDLTAGTTQLLPVRTTRKYVVFRDAAISRDGLYVDDFGEYCSGPSGGACDSSLMTIRRTPGTGSGLCNDGCTTSGPFPAFPATFVASDDGLTLAYASMRFVSDGSGYREDMNYAWFGARYGLRTTPLERGRYDAYRQAVALSGDGRRLFFVSHITAFHCRTEAGSIDPADGTMSAPVQVAGGYEGLPDTGCTRPVEANDDGTRLLVSSTATNLLPDPPVRSYPDEELYFVAES